MRKNINLSKSLLNFHCETSPMPGSNGENTQSMDEVYLVHIVENYSGSFIYEAMSGLCSFTLCKELEMATQM